MSATVKPLHGSYLMPSLTHASVGDAMHPGIIACEPDLPLVEVAKIMATEHVHCVAVIGVSHQGPECGVWGIISDLDLIGAGIDQVADATARSIATESVLTVDRRTSLSAATRIMLENGTSHLVVIERDSERPIGVLSSLDVAGVLAWGEA